MSNVESYSAQILQQLNSRIPFHIEAEKVGGQLRAFSPEIVLTGLRISIPNSEEPPIELAEGKISFHLFESIGAWFPQISKLSLDGLSLHGELTSEGKLLINGLGGGGETGDWLEEFLLNIESVDLTNNSLLLAVPNQQPQQLILDLALRRQGSERHMEAKVRSLAHRATVTAIAHGVGNPLNTDVFSGQLYLDISAQDIAPFQRLLNTPPPVEVRGALDTRVWLAWDRGEFSVEYTMTGTGLEVSAADQSWNFPVKALSMQARILRDGERWTIYASDLALSKGDATLHIPRVKLVSRGDSLNLRAADIPLAAINALLVDMALTPEAIADVFSVLNTRGQLTALQLDIADINRPLEDWHLAANFQQVEVDSWRGAPGLTQGRGYVALEPGLGQVIIDSQSFAMSYPTVYREALAYEDFYGTVDIAWDADDLTLSSGLMTATAQEGVALVLFGLNIPLVAGPVGLEMDLLVGLQDFDPSYRSKYLPYTLSEGLLGWLKPSIGGGRIEQGAFLWRGSLTPNTPEQKTIQLFFNVADTTLDYHPDWPAVTVLEGIVLIDDAQVSVWSENASLFDSHIRQLSAETWLNESAQMMLAIDGLLMGGADDGLKVVNDSPLSQLVGSSFAEWQLAGGLDTHLNLTLNIGDLASEPFIEVNTIWENVDLLIEPGGLWVEELSGQLSYSSASGFSSNKLAGRLWGKPLIAQVSQGEVTAKMAGGESPDQGFNAKTSPIVVDLSSRIAMNDVQSWLKLDAMGFAKGESEVAIKIELTPGQGALLSVDSDLFGTELDLPQPWYKTPLQRTPLHTETSLSEQSLLTKLTIANSLYLDVQLRGGELEGMTVSFYQPPKTIRPGQVDISGHVPLLDVDQWQQFVGDYIESDLLASFGKEQGLSVRVEKLHADTLLVGGQDLRDVVLDLKPQAGGWLLSAETDWVAGDFSFAHQGATPHLDIRYLDISQLDQLSFDKLADGAESETEGETDAEHSNEFSQSENEDAQESSSDYIVSLAEIRDGTELLGSLNFTLHQDPATVRAENITGALAGLTLKEEQPATLIWQRERGVEKTHLNAVFDFEDLGKTLEKLGYQKTLETENGQFVIQLEWPGGPAHFSLATVRGSVIASTGEGRFLNAPPGATGALRVVSILNLADIIGRLSLSSMFESGISFHAIAAEVFLQDGSIEVASMDVEGNSSGFQFSGVADVEKATLEGNLVVVLPLANNLPWVVALTAGLPVAAGVFVVSQVFKKQVNRFSSGVYRISGPWADPSVEFVKIFDDSTAKKKTTEVESVDPNTPHTSPSVQDPNTQVAVNSVADPNTPKSTPEPNVPLAAEHVPDPNIPVVLEDI